MQSASGVVLLFLVVFSKPTSSDLVIGYTARARRFDIAPRGQAVEKDGRYELCVAVFSGTLERGDSVNLRTLYVERRAEGKFCIIT